MTLAEMKRRVRVRLQLNQNTVLGDDPFLLQDIILSATDKIAERTYCLYGERTRGITDGEKNYCLPEFFRVDTVHILDGNGKWTAPTVYDNLSQMDALYGVSWRNDATEADVPQNAIFDSVNRVILYRTPSTTRAGALKFTGFYKPGQVWEYSSGVAVALADTQECPLPSWAHEAVVLESIAEGAMMDERPAITRQAQMLRDLAESARGGVEKQAAEYAQRNFNRVRNPFGFRR